MGLRLKYAENGICALCGKPVEDGTPIHGMTGNHYDCERPEAPEETLRKMDESLARGKAALNDLARKLGAR